MSYLQLADPYTRLAGGIDKSLYIFIPAGFMGAEKDVYVREDKFDNLPENEYQVIMQKLAPYQPQGLSGKRADRKAKEAADKEARRKERLEAKQKRVETRSGAFGNVLNKASDVLTGVIAGKSGVSVQTPGVDVSINQPTFWEKYKLPILISSTVITIAGVAYFVTKNKKSKR